MNLPDDVLKSIEELAGLFLAPREIAILLDLDGEDLSERIASGYGPVYKAYFRGKTISKKLIHENIVKMARHGSPQAEELAREMIVQQNSAEKRAKK